MGLNDFGAFSCKVVSKIADDKLAEIWSGLDFAEPADMGQMSSDELLSWYKSTQYEIERKLEEKGKQIFGDGYVDRLALTEGEGQFSVEDIAAGDYKLEMRFYERGNHNFADWRKLLFKSEYEFTMPEITSDNIGEVLNLGEVGFVPEMNLTSGEFAPEFEIRNMSGEKIGLGKFKEKALFIYYWDPLVDETSEMREKVENLKRVYEKLAGGGRFEILCVYYNDGPRVIDEVMKKYCKENSIRWCVGVGDSEFYRSYGIYDVLIGCDGRVKLVNPENVELEAAIAEAVGD